MISVLIFFLAISFLLSHIDIFWRPLFCLMTHFLDDNFAVILKSVTGHHNYFKGPVCDGIFFVSPHSFFFTTFIQNRREDALSRLSLSSVLHSLLFIFCFVWGKRSKFKHKPPAGAWELSTSLQRKWSSARLDRGGMPLLRQPCHIFLCLFAARKCRVYWRKSSKSLPGPEIF